MTGKSDAPARIEGWEGALLRAIEARRQARFAWGRFDCCLFAADVLLAITGVDAFARFRGRYRSSGGARRVMKQAGYGDLLEAASDVLGDLGFGEVAPLSARRGDIVAIALSEGNAGADGGFSHALGVAMAGDCLAPMHRIGLARRPLTHVERAWAVPFPSRGRPVGEAAATAPAREGH